MRQVLLVLALVSSSLAFEWTAKNIAALLNATPLKNYLDFLSPSLREELTKRQLNPASPGEDALHWCCKVKNGDPKPILKTRNQILYEKVSISVTTGYQGCGFLGTGRCAHSTARYHQEVRYGQKYMISPVFQDCPSEHVVCCAQFHLVNGNCIHNDHLVKHTGTFEFLHGIGLIKPNDQ